MKNPNPFSLKNNGTIILIYRIGAFILISLGLLASLRPFSVHPNPYSLFTYTIQSNLLVWSFFLFSIVLTLRKLSGQENDRDFGFCSAFSFAVCIDIIVTFLIFWCYLAPSGWMKNSLLSFKNLSIHFFCPLLMVLDRILFYRKNVLKKKQILGILIFPMIYVIQSFVLGLTHAVWFAPVGVHSYYMYPFLDLDAQGAMVFVYLIGLVAAFLGLSYLWYFLEQKAFKNK